MKYRCIIGSFTLVGKIEDEGELEMRISKLLELGLEPNGVEEVGVDLTKSIKYPEAWEKLDNDEKEKTNKRTGL